MQKEEQCMYVTIDRAVMIISAMLPNIERPCWSGAKGAAPHWKEKGGRQHRDCDQYTGTRWMKGAPRRTIA